MTRMRICAVVPILVLGLSSSAWADDDDPEEIADQLVIRLVPGTPVERINARYGTTTLDAIPSRDVYLLQLPELVDRDTFEHVSMGTPTS